MPPGQRPCIENSRPGTTQGGQYLLFELNRDCYALPIAQVVQVLGSVAPTPIPGAPVYFRGVLAFRRHVLPVLDLGLRLGLTSNGRPGPRVAIVAQAPGEPPLAMLLLVDRVEGVRELGGGDIEVPPSGFAAGCVDGVARLEKERLALILDAAGLLPREEARGLEETVRRELSHSPLAASAL